MIGDNNINFIGFMGTGKSRVGKRLSQKMGLEYIDTDEMIERETGMSIGEIFDQQGEAYFRKLERDLAKRLSGETKKIILWGGGVVLNPENIRNLKRGGTMVLLEAEPEEIYRRIKNDRTRPLLKENMNLKTIKELLAQRQEAYHNSGDMIINTTDKTVEEVCDEIISKLLAKS